MRASSTLAEVKDFLSSTPGVFVYAAGFAGALLTWYPGRIGIMPNFASGIGVSTYTYSADISSIVLLAILSIVWFIKPAN